jgi:hypothetical protein
MPDATIVLPVTYAAIFHAAMSVQEAWIAAAEAAQAPARYLSGLRQRSSLVYPAAGDPLRAMVVNVAPGAGQMEEGRPAVHLPSVIRWGQTPGSRRSKKGTYYLIVPFRHTTRSMPRRVYAVARTLQPGQRLTAGPSQGRAVHVPGLQPYTPRYAANVRPGYTHSAIQEGMRRVPGRRGSTYVTFRTMTQRSPGWNIPPKPGLHLAREVVQAMTPQVTRLIEQAFLADITAVVRQRLGV